LVLVGALLCTSAVDAMPGTTFLEVGRMPWCPLEMGELLTYKINGMHAWGGLPLSVLLQVPPILNCWSELTDHIAQDQVVDR